MKKILIPAFCLLVILGTALWFLVRRSPVQVPPAESQAAFTAEASGSGMLIHYGDGQTPLRALRWLQPGPEGIQAVQLLTQSDRQRLVLFKNGTMIANLLVACPSGVREGFFNFAELCDAIVFPGDVAVLLYRSADASTGELPLLLAVDLPSQATRWVHRAAGERLALSTDAKEGSVFLFGAATPIVRLPIALQKGEKTGSTPFRTAARSIDLPEEVKNLAELVATGPWGFLAAHAHGLSSYSWSKGWTHHPQPPAPSLAFADARPALAALGKTYWWQPFPGTLSQVKADGSTVVTYEAAALAPPEPWAKDSALMSLRGVDPSGQLWFTLATPSAPPSIATPAEPTSEPHGEAAPPPSTEKEWRAEGSATEASPIPAEDWATYASQGLERIYRWDPTHKSLSGRPLAEFWTDLALPQNVNRPAGFPRFRPESGQLLLESGPTAWVIPIGALPLKPLGPTSKGQAR